MNTTLSRLLTTAMAALLCLVGAATAQPRGDAKAQAAKAAQVAHIKLLVTNAASSDPRVRYAVRTGLMQFGPAAVGALNAAKAQQTDKHVRGFIERTVKAIKDRRRRETSRNRGSRGNRRGGGRGGMMGRGREVDIDRVAMEANLTWKQMDAVWPILKKARRQSTELFTEVTQDQGWRAMRDEDIRKDLTAALKESAEKNEAKLKEVLPPKQFELVKRHVNPWGRMMERMGQRGRDRNRGDRNRPRDPNRNP